MGRDDDSKSEMGGMSVDGGATSIGSGGVSGSAAAGGNMLKRSASPEDAVFGVLYTLSKDKAAPRFRTAIFIMTLDVVQLLVFILNPKFPWGDSVQSFLDQIKNLQLQNPVVSLGYDAYLAVFWALAIVLLGCFAICFYVGYAFRENKFNAIWPIVFVRRVVAVFITVFYTSTLNVLLESFDCQFRDVEKPMLTAFGVTETISPTDPSVIITTHTITCWEMPHAFTAVGGVVMAVLFVGAALLVALVEFEPDLRRNNPLGSADYRVEVMFFLAKTFVAVSHVLLSDYTLELAVLIALFSFFMVSSLVWLLPYRMRWVNAFRAGLFSVLFYSSCLLVVVVIRNDPSDDLMVILEVAGLVPAFILGYSAVQLREVAVDGRKLLRSRYYGPIIRNLVSGLGIGNGTDGVAADGGAGSMQHLRADGSMVFGVGQDENRPLARMPSMLHFVMATGFGITPTAISRRSPFTAPDQIERATRFVMETAARMELPDDAYVTVGRAISQARGSGMSASAVLLKMIHESQQSGPADGGGSTSPMLPPAQLFQQLMGGSPSVRSFADDDDFADLNVSRVSYEPQWRMGLRRWSRKVRYYLCGHAVMSWMGVELPSKGKHGRRNSDAQTHQNAEKLQLIIAIEEADTIYRHGLALFPESASLHLAYANFTLAFQGREVETLARFHIDRARKLNTTFQDRFLMFIRDTERKHAAQSEAVGESSMDLVSYVEFQNNMEAAITTHRATLKAMRRFWRTCAVAQAALAEDHAQEERKTLHHTDSSHSVMVLEADTRNMIADKGAGGGKGARTGLGVASRGSEMSMGSSNMMDDVETGSVASGGMGSENGAGSALWMDPGDVDALSRAFSKIDQLESKCNSIYTLLLDKYPRSVKLLRAYGQFASEVLNDRKKSARAFTEAARLEELQRDAVRFAKSKGDAGTGLVAGQSVVDPGSDGLVVISSAGIIMTINKAAAKMFGYAERDLVGRNVSVLCPPPHAQMHNTYIQNYLNTGISHVLGQKRRVEAKHLDGHTFAVELGISQVETRNGITFAGVVRKLREEALSARLTIDSAGLITSANQPMLRMFGYDSLQQLLGKNVSALMPMKYAINHDNYLSRYKRTGEATVVGVRGRRLEGLHRSGFSFPISVEIEVKEVGNDILFESVITELTDAYGMVTINETGEILSVNMGMLSLFGYADHAELVGNNVSMLMPLPYAAYHNANLKRYMTTGKASILGRNRHVLALHRDGSTFPVTLEVSELKDQVADDAGGAAKPGILSKNTSKKKKANAEDVDDSRTESSGGAGGGGGIASSGGTISQAFMRGQRVFVGKITMLDSGDEDLAAAVLGSGRPPAAPGSPEGAGNSAAGGTGAVTSDDVRLHMANGEGSPGDGMPEPGVTTVSIGPDLGASMRGDGVGGTGAGPMTEDDKQRLKLLASRVDPLLGRVSITLNGTITAVNDQACKQFGYSDATHMVGKNVTILMSQDFAVDHDSHLQRYARERTPHIVGTPGRHLFGQRSDGSLFPISLRVQERASIADMETGHILPSVVYYKRPNLAVSSLHMEYSPQGPFPGTSSPLLGSSSSTTTTKPSNAGSGGPAGMGAAGLAGMMGGMSPPPGVLAAAMASGASPPPFVAAMIAQRESTRRLSGNEAMLSSMGASMRGGPAAAAMGGCPVFRAQPNGAISSLAMRAMSGDVGPLPAPAGPRLSGGSGGFGAGGLPNMGASARVNAGSGGFGGGGGGGGAPMPNMGGCPVMRSIPAGTPLPGGMQFSMPPGHPPMPATASASAGSSSAPNSALKAQQAQQQSSRRIPTSPSPSTSRRPSLKALFTPGTLGMSTANLFSGGSSNPASAAPTSGSAISLDEAHAVSVASSSAAHAAAHAPPTTSTTAAMAGAAVALSKAGSMRTGFLGPRAVMEGVSEGDGGQEARDSAAGDSQEGEEGSGASAAPSANSRGDTSGGGTRRDSSRAYSTATQQLYEGQVPLGDCVGYDGFIYALEELEAVVEMDAAGLIVAINGACAYMFGWWVADLIGQPITVLQPPELAVIHQEFVDAYVSKKKAKKFLGSRRVVEARHRDGAMLKVIVEIAEKWVPARELALDPTTGKIKPSVPVDAAATEKLSTQVQAALAPATSPLSHAIAVGEGNIPLELHFVGRMVLATQSRQELDSQAKSAVQRLLLERRRKKAERSRKGKGERKNKSRSSIPEGALPGQEARRNVDLAIAMGLMSKEEATKARDEGADAAATSDKEKDNGKEGRSRDRSTDRDATTARSTASERKRRVSIVESGDDKKGGRSVTFKMSRDSATCAAAASASAATASTAQPARDSQGSEESEGDAEAAAAPKSHEQRLAEARAIAQAISAASEDVDQLHRMGSFTVRNSRQVSEEEGADSEEEKPKRAGGSSSDVDGGDGGNDADDDSAGGSMGSGGNAKSPRKKTLRFHDEDDDSSDEEGGAGKAALASPPDGRRRVPPMKRGGSESSLSSHGTSNSGSINGSLNDAEVQRVLMGMDSDHDDSTSRGSSRESGSGSGSADSSTKDEDGGDTSNDRSATESGSRRQGRDSRGTDEGAPAKSSGGSGGGGLTRTASFVSRSRERQLRQMSRNQKIAAHAHRLFLAGAWAMMMIAAAVVVPYTVLETLVMTHTNAIMDIQQVSEAALLSTQLAMDSRRMQVGVAQLGAACNSSLLPSSVSLWYSPGDIGTSTASAYVTQILTLRDRMASRAERLDATLSGLRDGSGLYGTSSGSSSSNSNTGGGLAMRTQHDASNKLRELFEMPTLPFLRFVDTRNPYSTLVHISLWDLGRQLAVQAQAVAARTLDIVTGSAVATTAASTTTPGFALQPASSVSNTTYFVPLTALRPLNESLEFHTLLSNAPGSVTTAWWAALQGTQDSASSDQQTVLTTQIVVLVLQISTPLVLLVFLLRPLLLRVAAERVAMFRVFLRVPPDVITRLTRLPVTVGESTGDEDSSDDEDHDAGQAGTAKGFVAGSDESKDSAGGGNDGAGTAHGHGPTPGGGGRKSSVVSFGGNHRASQSTLVSTATHNHTQASGNGHHHHHQHQHGTHSHGHHSNHGHEHHGTWRRSVTSLVGVGTAVMAVMGWRARAAAAAAAHSDAASRGRRSSLPSGRGSAKVHPADAVPTVAPGSHRNAFVSLVLSMPKRIVASVCVVVMLLVAIFLSGYLLVQAADHAASSLAVAGMRSALAGRVQFFAQELMVSATALQHGGAALSPAITVAGSQSSQWFTAATEARNHYYRIDAQGDAAYIVGADNNRGLEEFVEFARAGLADAALQLRRYHTALIYGDVTLGVQPSVYGSQAQADLLMKSGCLRTTAPCVPSTHPYYRVTTGGLHALLMYYTEQALQLANQTVPALASGSISPGSGSAAQSTVADYPGALPSGFRNARYDFLWSVSETDLAAGLSTSVDLYAAASTSYSTRYSIGNGVVFAVFMLALGSVYFGLFRPYIKRISAETHRAASLLRSLPVDITLMAPDADASNPAAIAGKAVASSKAGKSAARMRVRSMRSLDSRSIHDDDD